MKINNPIRIAVFLSVVIFGFAFAIFFIAEDNINRVYSFCLFFLCTIGLIYYVVKNFFHEKIKVIYNPAVVVIFLSNSC